MQTRFEKFRSLQGMACIALWVLSCATWASSAAYVIKIKNSGPTDCILKQQRSLYGHVAESTGVPKIIPSDQVVSFTMKPETILFNSHIPSIVLTYSCSNHHEVTLFSDQVRWQGKEWMYGKVFDAKNILATSQAYDTNGTYLTTRPLPRIEWTLIHLQAP